MAALERLRCEDDGKRRTVVDDAGDGNANGCCQLRVTIVSILWRHMFHANCMITECIQCNHSAPWNMMFIAPRSCGGAISEMKIGTA